MGFGLTTADIASHAFRWTSRQLASSILDPRRLLFLCQWRAGLRKFHATREPDVIFIEDQDLGDESELIMTYRLARNLNVGRRLLLVAAGWASVAVGQTQVPAVPPEFEVASVKPAPPPMNGVSSRESVDGALLTYTNFTLQRLISNAYGVTERQIIGPAWIADNLFDIHARLPPRVSRSDVPAMLRRMLADRFKLVIEREKREMAVYALVIAKGGHKMKPVLNNDSGYGGGIRRIDGRGVTIATLAQLLSSRVTDRPVVDATGLGGRFAFSLEWAPEPDGPSVYTAVQEQLGLKLEPRRMLTEVITVRRAERIPTEN